LKRIFETAGDVSLSSLGDTCIFLEGFTELLPREKGLYSPYLCLPLFYVEFYLYNTYAPDSE